jgi:hypothetical protein
MAVIQRVRRVANPKRRRYSSKRVVRNAKGRFVRKASTHRRRTAKSNPKRKRTTPVIKRYSVKVLKKELRRRGVKANPGTHKRRRRYTRTRARTAVRRRRSNPILIELGAINPRRSKHMAAHKTHRRRRRTTNPARAAVRRRRRPVAVSTHRRRRRYTRRASNPAMRTSRRRTVRRRHNRRFSVRRNPTLFGMSGGKDLLAMTGGVLVGVAATKYLPTILPASITSLGGGSPFVGVLITGAAAFAAGYAARKFGGNAFGDAVLLGGLAQAASQLLTIIAPPSLTSALALSGMGDIMAGNFVVPQNPIKAGMPMQVVAMPSKTGVGAFRGAFGSRR